MFSPLLHLSVSFHGVPIARWRLNFIGILLSPMIAAVNLSFISVSAFVGALHLRRMQL